MEQPTDEDEAPLRRCSSRRSLPSLAIGVRAARRRGRAADRQRQARRRLRSSPSRSTCRPWLCRSRHPAPGRSPVPDRTPVTTPTPADDPPSAAAVGGNAGAGHPADAGNAGGGNSGWRARRLSRTTPPRRPSAQTPATARPASRNSGSQASRAADPQELEAQRRRRRTRTPSPTLAPEQRRADPARNPTFFDALPGPSTAVDGVPNFVIQKFQVPPFLLPIYQAAGIQYGIRWEVLAAINEIETDYGRNLNVSSAGAVGWMQFMPSTWKMYGVDAQQGRQAQGPVQPGRRDLRRRPLPQGRRRREGHPQRAIFAYNHAGWYVDSVMLRARLIAGVPADLDRLAHRPHRGPLPGLRARALRRRPRRGSAAKQRQGRPERRARHRLERDPARHRHLRQQGAPVVAVNDGVVKKIGSSQARRPYVVLQDVYGNRTRTRTSARSRSSTRCRSRTRSGKPAPSVAGAASASQTPSDPKPTAPASRRHAVAPRRRSRPRHAPKEPARAPQRRPRPPRPHVRASPSRQRLFAHPQPPGARGRRPRADLRRQATASGFATYDNYFSGALGLNAEERDAAAAARRARTSSAARCSAASARPTPSRRRTSTSRSARPARAPRRSTRSRSSTAGSCSRPPPIYRASGKNALYGRRPTFSIGQVLLLPKPLLEKRVLSRPAHRHLPRRPRRHPAPARSTAACSPRSSTSPSPGSSPTVTCLSAATAT